MATVASRPTGTTRRVERPAGPARPAGACHGLRGDVAEAGSQRRWTPFHALNGFWVIPADAVAGVVAGVIARDRRRPGLLTRDGLRPACAASPRVSPPSRGTRRSQFGFIGCAASILSVGLTYQIQAASHGSTALVEDRRVTQITLAGSRPRGHVDAAVQRRQMREHRCDASARWRLSRR